MDDLARCQLSAVAVVLDVAASIGADVWLRGGWAVDFTLGRVTRPNVDVDWFAWREDLPRLVEELVQRGWSEVGEYSHEQQRDLRLNEVELGFAPLSRASDGSVVVGGGSWSGASWPTGMLDDALIGRIGALACLVISAAAQVEIKQMMPVWVPGMRRRTKDTEDIALIQSALADQAAT